MQEVLRIGLRELRYLEVVCPGENCGIGIVLDMGSPTQGYPAECPSCGTKFSGVGSTLPEMLSSFKDFYRGLSNSKTKPSFRLVAGGIE